MALVGNSIFIHACHQVFPEKIYFNFCHPLNHKYYHFFPVKVAGKFWFLPPGSTDLVPLAPEIDCTSVPHTPSMDLPSNFSFHAPSLFPTFDHHWKLPIFNSPLYSEPK